MSDLHLGKYGLRLLQSALTDDFSHAFYVNLEDYLERELPADKVTIEKFTHGSHWISVPLKVNVRTSNESRSLFAKVVTQKGLRNFNYAVKSRNLRVRILADLCGLRYEGARSKHDVLSYEAATLLRFRAAQICAPKPLRLFDTGSYSLLTLEYIKGIPLGEGTARRQDAVHVLQIVRQLRDNKLVHGDIKLDNFVRTKDGSIYLIDCLNWTGPLLAAMHYDLASAIYSLSQKLEPSAVLQVARQSFTVSEISGALELIDLAGVQADALTDGDKALQIKAAMQSF
ncbi:MAG: hypothetical protein ACXVIP_01325 [Halobacteriota archaeon]